MEKKRGKKQGKRRRDTPEVTTEGFQNLRYFQAEKKKQCVYCKTKLACHNKAIQCFSI